MGDPLSITASAAGFISLGITVCQGLIDYCQAFTGQYRDVRVVVQDLQGLENSLTLLRDSLTHRPDLLDLLRPYIVTLKGRTDDLQPILDRFRANTPKENVSGQRAFKDKMKTATQRTLYPFKKGMVSELRDTVRHAQDNLSLALQVVQVHLLTHVGEGDISTLVRQSAVAQPLLLAVRQNMHQMASSLNGGFETVTLQLQRISQEIREMSDTTASARTPDPWATSDQSFEKVLPHVEKVETTEPGETQKTLTEFRRCNCAKILRRQTKSLWTSTWSLSWSSSATSRHLKTCQYWTPSQEVWTAKLSVSHVNLLAAMVLSASIQISKQAGIFSISPSLNLRGVVNGSSPAFALLKNLGKLYECPSRPIYRPVPISELGKQTSVLTRSILRLLKAGAVSPYEVDENGRTLLHYALSCANSRYAVDEVPAFQELIQTLLDAGVAINEVDLAGETAFDYLISDWAAFNPERGQRKSVCEFVANKGGEMSDALLRRSFLNETMMAIELQHMAMLEPWQDVTQSGPLSVAFWRKSEQDVIRILRTKPSSIHELNRRKQNPLHLACCWPRGIQLLLDAGANYLLHQVDVCGGLPITYSTSFGCLDAIQLLLNAGSAFSSAGWFQYSEQSLDLVFLPFVDIIPDFLLSTLQERRRELFELAKHTLPAEVWADLDMPTDRLLDERAAEIQRVLVDADIEIPKSISVPLGRTTVYHCRNITAKKANQLWDAGFRDIDSWDESGRTPIMDCCGPIVGDTSLRSLMYAQWLLHHGADHLREIRYIRDDKRDKREPVAGRTALHCIANHVGLNIMGFLPPKFHSALQMVYGLPLFFEELLVKGGSHDDCDCACSSSGCTPFTILLKTILRPSLNNNISEPWEYTRLLVHCLELPGHPASSAPMRSRIAEEVIRFETFEALQLSHTCCGFEYYDACRRYTPEDVREIHEEWEEVLSEHEDLVSEFCHKFQELGGTLTSFLEGYWQTRMDEVFEEEKPYDEEDIRRLREIGVVLEGASEESEEDFTNEDVNDEDVTDDDITDEVTQEELTDEWVTDEDLTDEDVVDEDQSEGSNNKEEHNQGT